MDRDRISLAFISLTLAVAAAMSCTTSEPIGTGAMVPTGSGNAGTSGGAGSSSTGAAGSLSTAGAAGMTGAAGSNTGVGGITGTAGSTTGAAGAAGSTAGATGAAGSGVDAGTDAIVSLSYATDIEPIVTMKCGSGGTCHTSGTPPANLQMKMGSGFASLVTNGAVTTTACTLLDAANKKRVIPGNPNKSLMWIKLSTAATALTTANCGASMPKTGTLTMAEKTKIHDWIMAGANP
jgi:hypothetical protein